MVSSRSVSIHACLFKPVGSVWLWKYILLLLLLLLLLLNSDKNMDVEMIEDQKRAAIKKLLLSSNENEGSENQQGDPES
jgi:hypothetical protein